MLRKFITSGIVALGLSVSAANAANVVETAASTGQFETLLAAATAAGLAETLGTTKNITVFAPTDDAFKKLPAGTVETLLKPENKDQLVAILTYHVLPREVRSTDLPAGSIKAKTLNTSGLVEIVNSGGVKVDNANVVQADIETDNGVIHVIDAVLIPGS